MADAKARRSPSSRSSMSPEGRRNSKLTVGHRSRIDRKRISQRVQQSRLSRSRGTQNGGHRPFRQKNLHGMKELLAAFGFDLFDQGVSIFDVRRESLGNYKVVIHNLLVNGAATSFHLERMATNTVQPVALVRISSRQMTPGGNDVTSKKQRTLLSLPWNMVGIRNMAAFFTLWI